MIVATLEDGTVIEAVSFGNMLEKAHKRGQRVRDYNWVGRKTKKVKNEMFNLSETYQHKRLDPDKSRT